jgi:AraC-like DNA-binding protein
VLLNFNLQNGFESTSPSGFQGHTFSFQRSRLRELAKIVGLFRPLDELIGRASIWETPAVRMLGRRLQVISGVLESKGRLPHGCAELINDEIGLTILGAVAADTRRSGKATPSHRSRVLRDALEIIRERDRLPISVTTLALEVNTSLSTLQRAFVDEFGVLPKAYIRMRCLSAVRDELSNSPPGTCVADIANQWGFWHMGQFARDFRRMFGVLPSQQL